MDEDARQPTIDWSTLKFPTDAITLGDVRRREPDYFVQAAHAGARSGAERPLAIKTVALEMALAEHAFDACSGRLASPDRPQAGDLADELIECYARIGIGSGFETRHALVCRIVADASAQAGRSGGRGR